MFHPIGTTTGGPIGGTITVRDDIELESTFVSCNIKPVLDRRHKYSTLKSVVNAKFSNITGPKPLFQKHFTKNTKKGSLYNRLKSLDYVAALRSTH